MLQLESRETTAHMDRQTPVFIVCSPLPHVGKTLIARLLVEYLHADGRAVAAFDLNPDDYTLAALLPEHTTIANIADTKGQMALFDQLIVADGLAKVVDLGYACFERFFSIMQDIDFEAEAQKRGILPVILFVAEPDTHSIQAYGNLQDRFPELSIVPVLNAGAGTPMRPRSGFKPNYALIPLHIPLLTPALKATLQRSGLLSASADNVSAYNTAELRAWLRRLFLQFRELELRLMLEALMPTLKFGA